MLVWRDDTVVHANRAAVAMLGGASQGDIVARSIFDFVDSSEEALARERMPTLGGATSPVSLGELTMVRVDGKPVHVETTVVSVLFDGATSMLGVIRDVSARRELVARAMQMDRMLAVGTLAAGVGHEINNPLAYAAMANLDVSRTSRSAERRVSSRAIGEAAPAAARRRRPALRGRHPSWPTWIEGAHRIRDIARDLNTFARSDAEAEPGRSARGRRRGPPDGHSGGALPRARDQGI